MQRLTAKEQCEHIENRPAVLKERHRVPLKEITQQLLLTETAKLKNKKAHQCAKLFPKILHKANTQLLFTYSLARVSKHTEVNIKLAGHTSVLVAQQSTHSQRQYRRSALRSHAHRLCNATLHPSHTANQAAAAARPRFVGASVLFCSSGETHWKYMLAT